MANNYCIYNIISPSGKTYIGVTNSFNRRMSEHFSDWKNRKQNIALHNSFSKYGFDNHIKEVIIYNLSKEMAYKLEELSINDCKTNNSKIGLNSRTGGQGGNIIDWKSEIGIKIRENQIDKLKQKYKSVWDKRLPLILEHKDISTILEISKMLNCSTSALCRYLKDNSIKIKRKPKYDLNDIAKQIAVYYKEGYTNHYVIRKTGYSNGTICRAKKLIKNNLHS